MRTCYTDDGFALSLYRFLLIVGAGTAEGHRYLSLHFAWTRA